MPRDTILMSLRNADCLLAVAAHGVGPGGLRSSLGERSGGGVEISDYVRFKLGSAATWQSGTIETDTSAHQAKPHTRRLPMTTLKSIATAAALTLAAAGAALAHDTTPVDRTQARQAWEIEQSRQTGQLTRREYRALQAEQARIADLERQAKADGNVTGREYRAIREAQRDAAGHIYTESNDRQVNWWRRWKSGY